MKKIQLTSRHSLLFVLTLSISTPPLLRVASAHDWRHSQTYLP